MVIVAVLLLWFVLRSCLKLRSAAGLPVDVYGSSGGDAEVIMPWVGNTTVSVRIHMSGCAAVASDWHLDF